MNPSEVFAQGLFGKINHAGKREAVSEDENQNSLARDLGCARSGTPWLR